MGSMTQTDYRHRYYYRFILVANPVWLKVAENYLSTLFCSQHRKKQLRNTVINRLKRNDEKVHTSMLTILPQTITQIPIIQARHELPAVSSM